jgi:hypothetical protein
MMEIDNPGDTSRDFLTNETKRSDANLQLTELALPLLQMARAKRALVETLREIAFVDSDPTPADRLLLERAIWLSRRHPESAS